MDIQRLIDRLRSQFSPLENEAAAALEELQTLLNAAKVAEKSCEDCDPHLGDKNNELARQVCNLQGETQVLASIMRDALAVIETIEAENTDEEERLWQLRYSMKTALAAYEDTGA